MEQQAIITVKNLRTYFYSDKRCNKVLNGVSVWDYITEQRINLAQYQLETTEKSVTQVSEACGFNSIANFNRAFKKLTGMTPREYRRSILQEGR